MNARFLQVAKTELDEAVNYYNRERPGLGYELLWEVFFAIDRIKQFPQAWPVFYEDASFAVSPTESSTFRKTI